MQIRKLSWTLLLPLLLLFAQQGELRHAYSHYGKQAAGSQQKAPGDGEPCSVCLAYAHIAGAAKADVAAMALLAGLAFHVAPTFDVVSAESALTSPRSRGPPSF